MTNILQGLVQKARTELGSTACQAGRHQWAFNGGRGCPHDLDPNCSQAVYSCRVCGADDYGGAGGPGEADCAHGCHHKAERLAKTTRDPLTLQRHIALIDPKRAHLRRLGALRAQPKPLLP